MKVRIRFAKAGILKYIGHLDTLRFFQKALRRSGLPVRLSEGFHPHQLTTFAQPLGVGITSEGEYFDLELTEDVPCEEILERLNRQMPEDVSILSVHALPDKSKNAMASVCAAKYFVFFKELNASVIPDMDFWNQKIQEFLNRDEIPAEKKTKKSTRTIDLKPLVYEFSCREITKDFKAEHPFFPDTEEEFMVKTKDPVFSVFLSAGSEENIPPDFLFGEFMNFVGIAKDAYVPGIHRVDLLQQAPENSLTDSLQNAPDRIDLPHDSQVPYISMSL